MTAGDEDSIDKDLLSQLEQIASEDFSKESEERWRLIREVQKRADDPGLDRALAWVRDERPLIRCLGADVLAQFGEASEASIHSRVIDSLEELLEDANTDVRACALVALGHREGGATTRIAALREHPSAEVRLAVLFALTGRDEPEAIDALTVLSADPYEDVRNGALFALGVHTTHDSAAIRDALVFGLQEEDDETRLDAVYALAQRQDPRVVEAIVKELTSKQVRGFAIHAALVFPRAEFVDSLARLNAIHPQSQEVKEALVACQAVSPA